ncbi:hypothetical protein A2U01_0106094, partial [Trifolium medium]|nr:hypothetical protein [Trifolium medium]
GSSGDRRRKAATKLAWCRLATAAENGGSKRTHVSKPTAEESSSCLATYNFTRRQCIL